MRRTKRTGSFWLCLAINLLLNLEGTIPAIILLVLHFVLGWSVWWAVGAFALWILGMVLWMRFMGWASAVSSEADRPKENKNPYSVKKQNQ